MTEIIEADIPQLPVNRDSSFSVISKEFLLVLADNYLWSYLREKFHHVFTRHNRVNQMLQDVYLEHQMNKDKRQAGEMYPLDSSHYAELDQVEAICRMLYQITMELVVSIYFMDYLNRNQRYPPHINREEILEQLITNSNPLVSERLISSKPFIDDIQRIWESINGCFIHPPYDNLILGDEPSVFINKPERAIYATVDIISLRQLIEQYLNFFKCCKAILKDCSPEAFASGLRD